MGTPSAVLLTGGVLCNNPRVIKDADTLADAGWDVEVLGAWITDEYVARDRAVMAGRGWRWTPVVQPSSSAWPRVRTRLAREVGARTGLRTGRQLGYAGPELLRTALERQADIYVAHSEPALWAIRQLATRGCRVGVDFEDWFSRDNGADQHRRHIAAYLEDLERHVVRVAALRMSPSRAMSAAISAAYDCEPPAVVYNAFPWSERARFDGARRDRTSCDRPSLLWYSQTIGPGRGLELLCAALAEVSADAEVHIRGKSTEAYRTSLVSRLPDAWKSRVFFHAPVSVDELPSRIAEHDIAFSGEDAASPSRDLTITNKVLHGLVAGLAVVASDTAGTREVAVLAPGAVFVFDAGQPGSLAACLRALLQSRETLTAAQAAALNAARSTLSWEHQQPTLLEAYTRARASSPERPCAAS
jgi:glycosyltransferase involved in cell wall biosynthesis